MSSTATIERGTLPVGPGVRRFALGALINSAGIGLFYSFALLYYRAASGLSLSTIGIVLTLATLAVLPLVPAVGRLADRTGPKQLLVIAALVRAGTFVGYETTHGLAPFALITMAAALGTRAEQLAAPMLCATAPESEASRWIGLYRVAFNAGVGGGALLASALVQATGYHCLGRLSGVCFLAAAAFYATLPTARPAPRGSSRGPHPPGVTSRFCESRRSTQCCGWSPWRSNTGCRSTSCNS